MFSSPRLGLPSTASHCKRDQEKNDSNGPNDVRSHGNRTGKVARVRPNQAHNRPHDEKYDHSG
jgi:hypothetical protein